MIGLLLGSFGSGQMSRLVTINVIGVAGEVAEIVISEGAGDLQFPDLRFTHAGFGYAVDQHC
jgi:hypothetical protein